jgi:alcohol dehydrogenase class IV
MLLPTVTEFSIKGHEKRYATCARAMKWASEKDNDAIACSKLIESLFILNDDLKVPSPRILGYSADQAMLKLMASQALASGSPQNNPRVPTQNQIIQLYEEVWG